MNRATYSAVWVTGEAALLCGMHAERCRRAGGFTQPIPKAAEYVELSVAEVREQRYMGAIAKRERIPQYDLERALRQMVPEFLVGILRKALDDVSPVGGLSPPEPAEIEEAPGLPPRRSQGASDRRSKRGKRA